MLPGPDQRTNLQDHTLIPDKEAVLKNMASFLILLFFPRGLNINHHPDHHHSACGDRVLLRRQPLSA